MYVRKKPKQKLEQCPRFRDFLENHLKLTKDERPDKVLLQNSIDNKCVKIYFMIHIMKNGVK